MEYFLCGLGPIPTSGSANMLVRWERPGQGKLKLNTDGSAQGNSGLAGGGGILRDDQGNQVLGYSRKIGRTTSFLVELWALRDRLHLCLSKNHLDVEVELDAKIIVDALTTTQQSDQLVSPLIDDCRFLATRFNHIQFKHCYHEANKCTDGLTRKGITQIDDFFIYDNPPVELENNFIHDLNGLYSIRHCTVSLLDSQINEFPFSTKNNNNNNNKKVHEQIN